MAQCVSGTRGWGCARVCPARPRVHGRRSIPVESEGTSAYGQTMKSGSLRERRSASAFSGNQGAETGCGYTRGLQAPGTAIKARITVEDRPTFRRLTTPFPTCPFMACGSSGRRPGNVNPACWKKWARAVPRNQETMSRRPTTPDPATFLGNSRSSCALNECAHQPALVGAASLHRLALHRLKPEPPEKAAHGQGQ
jgi:hypothetical protein